MPTAICPDGRKTLVEKRLEVSVSFPDSKTRAKVERAVREGLADDPRQLFVRIQGGGGYGPWCFWVQWGFGPSRRTVPAVILRDDEHDTNAILARIRDTLSTLLPVSQSQTA